MELNFQGLQMQMQKKKKGTFLVFFADDNKTLVTVYVKHLKIVLLMVAYNATSHNIFWES